MKSPLIIYHGSCADGFTAAWIAKKALNASNILEAELHPGVYGQPLPDVAGRDVYVLDFSYPLAQMEDLIAKCNSLTWLDHHATAIAESGHLMPDYKSNADTDKHPHVGKVFGELRTDRSGAWLTWEWFHTDAVPMLVQLVDDRDRWVFADSRSKPFAAGLFGKGYTDENWDAAADNIEGIIREGEVIEAKEDKDIAEHLDLMTVWVRIAGIEVPTANLTYMSASKAGHELLQRHPNALFAATWFLRNDGRRVYSLRSRTGSGVDVGAVAKRFGGGGHKHASGFTVGAMLDNSDLNP